MTVLASLGGQVVAIIGISAFLLNNYQKFSYDKSALKQLYYQETKEEYTDSLTVSEDANLEDRKESSQSSWNENLRSRFRNRKEMMDLRYATYIFLPFLSCLCCCIMRRYNDEDNWYSRRRRSLDKFAIAKEKLKSEVDMKEIIKFQRVSKFLHRLQSTRR